MADVVDSPAAGVVTPADSVPSSWKPTRKWITAQAVAISAILVAWASSGAWSVELTIALIGWVTQAATTYLVPNDPTPGGVPLKNDPLI